MPSRRSLLACSLVLALCGCPKAHKTQPQGVDPTAHNGLSTAVRAQIKTTMKGIQKACITFNAKNGRWPEDMEELVESKVWLAVDRADPWGNDYVIECEGQTVKVTTYGLDAKPGGEGRDTDYSVE
jgi:hypothetical protein